MENKKRLFSTEQVSRWHPDKTADIVSDTILTYILRKDSKARVAIECLIKNGHCFLAGEYTTSATEINDDALVRVASDKLRELDIEYKTKDYHFTVELTRQSVEINKAVDKENGEIGAGDQGIMFGYATRETYNLLPYGFDTANKIIERIEKLVIEEKFKILKGDAKCQVTVDLNKKPDIKSIDTILISVCHQPNYSLENIQEYIMEEVIKPLGLFKKEIKYLINPAGSWTIGGPTADAGVGGRKIVCDQYGGYSPVGGGSLSTKDATKVDRSATYMARYLATHIVEEIPEIATCELQLAYAIGVAQPVSVNYTYTTIKNQNKTVRGEIDARVDKIIESYDLTPQGIINTLRLLSLDYGKIAGGCHFRNKQFAYKKQ